MAAVKGGHKLKAVLEAMARKIEGANAVRVGFPSSARYPDGTYVAMVAAIHNYGAPAAGIPARPFFSNMVKEKSPDWGPQLGKMIKASHFQAHQALALMGEQIGGDLRESIIHGKWAGNAESTKAGKKFDKALIDTGHMLNSVHYEVDHDDWIPVK